MVMPMILETIQYKDSPLGNCRAKNPSIIGIIHSIIFWLDCCRGSRAAVMVIFCCTQDEAATSNGMTTGDGSGLARCNHRNLSFRGAAV